MKTVLVQAGHLSPRQPGFETGTGTAGEQEFVRDVCDRLVRLLAADGRFRALPMPGRIPAGIKCDAALFLHADGSTNKKVSGYSFGYPNYAVNKKLADLVAAEFDRLLGHPPHHADNYTADQRGYYGFGLVDTPGPEVLVEHGFLTNPAEATWLRAHAGELAAAEYRALLRYFGLGPKKNPARPKLTVHLVDRDGTEHWIGAGWVQATAYWARFRSGQFESFGPVERT